MTDLLSLSGVYRIEEDPQIPGSEEMTWPFEYKVEVTRDENDKDLYNIANDVTSGGQYMENFIQIRDNKDGTYNLTYDEYGDGNYQSIDEIDEDILMNHLNHLINMDTAVKVSELPAEEMTETEEAEGAEEVLEESVVFNKKDLDSLEKELRDKLHQVMVFPTLGFCEDEVDEYSGIQITDEDGCIKITAYAEVGFDNLWTISDSLNKVLKRYDSDAYFDMEDEGRLIAYIGTSKLKESVDKSSTLSKLVKSGYTRKEIQKFFKDETGLDMTPENSEEFKRWLAKFLNSADESKSINESLKEGLTEDGDSVCPKCGKAKCECETEDCKKHELKEDASKEEIDGITKEIIGLMTDEELTRDDIFNKIAESNISDRISLKRALELVDELDVKQKELFESKKEKPARKRKRKRA